MTSHSVYIGELEDPAFKWDGGNWNSNVPNAITPGFPNSSMAFDRIWSGIRNGSMDGKQTDYGGFVARMTKKEIMDCVDQWYPKDTRVPHPDNAYKNHDYEQLLKLLPALEKLDDKKVYALVASEL